MIGYEHEKASTGIYKHLYVGARFRFDNNWLDAWYYNTSC